MSLDPGYQRPTEAIELDSAIVESVMLLAGQFSFGEPGREGKIYKRLQSVAFTFLQCQPGEISPEIDRRLLYCLLNLGNKGPEELRGLFSGLAQEAYASFLVNQGFLKDPLLGLTCPPSPFLKE